MVFQQRIPSRISQSNFLKFQRPTTGNRFGFALVVNQFVRRPEANSTIGKREAAVQDAEVQRKDFVVVAVVVQVLLTPSGMSTSLVNQTTPRTPIRPLLNSPGGILGPKR